MRIPAEHLRRDIGHAETLIWLLVTGELITPRGFPGPLARPWVARGRSRSRRGARNERGRPQQGDRD
jgi:hypothetical protein